MKKKPCVTMRAVHQAREAVANLDRVLELEVRKLRAVFGLDPSRPVTDEIMAALQDHAIDGDYDTVEAAAEFWALGVLTRLELKIVYNRQAARAHKRLLRNIGGRRAA